MPNLIITLDYYTERNLIASSTILESKPELLGHQV